MLRFKLYYHAKPFLPWSLRMAVRRFFALRKRRRFEQSWPIDPKTIQTPPDWSGWPDGKQFAFILSHDVESQLGYDNLDRLLEIEESLGFRSVVNFVPEGEYTVTKERIQDLNQRGFEVGVHGLYHDGKLYNSKPDFTKRATRINQYLSDWSAVGFRSPLMHHNLDWIHELNIEYDSSTFDTDPFEPQPDALGTIFPKWIPNPNFNHPAPSTQNPVPNTDPTSPITKDPTSGYLELPYTLPQDSTLYLLLLERTNKVWIEKTKWIAGNGGMAFVNVHPDYIDFEGSGGIAKYPENHYSDFLKQVKQSQDFHYWHGLPKDLAKLIRQKQLDSIRL